MQGFKHIKIISLFFLFSFLITTGFCAPPRVIKTIPRRGEQNVDSNLEEIRVVFSQDMTTGRNYSVCGSGPKYPEIIDEPRWLDNRTFSIPVKLAPNHEYQLGINCPSYKNFRSADGISAVPYPLRFKTARKTSGPKIKKLAVATNRTALRKLRKLIDENYSYRDIHNINWDKLFAERAAEIRDAETPEEFAALAAELLATAEDKHIWLRVGEQHFSSYVNPVTPNANFSKLKEIVPNWQKYNQAVTVGRFEDAIGYILIDSWQPSYADTLEELYTALWDFADTPGIIIDVRRNSGGSELLARDFAGCFIDEPKTYAKHVIRSANEPNGFTKPHNRIFYPNKSRPRYRGKVAVLTGPVVISSGEAFLLMMKQVPNCKLVGAPSQGSSGNPKAYRLGNGVTVFLPSWKAMRPDGSCFETEGIVPDILVETTQSELVNKDPVLEAALKFLRRF